MAERHRVLKQIRHPLTGCNNGNIVFGNAKLLLIPLRLLLLKFRLIIPDFLDPLITDHHRGQVWIREITVILGIFLGTHGIGIFFVIIPPSRLLDHFAAVLQNLDLAFPLILNDPGDRLKGIEVFHLRAGPVFTGAHLPDRQVHIRAHGSLIQLAVGSAQILDRGTQLFQIGDDLFGTAHIRLRYDLDQRYSRTVIVYKRTVLPLVMHQFPGVFFHMDLVDADLLSARRRLNLHASVDTDGQIQL